MKSKLFLVLGLIILSLAGCGVNNVPIKTEYYLGENAIIDHYEIKMTHKTKLDNYNGKNGSFLKVNYTLTNKSSSSKTVTYNDFKFYNKDEQLIVPITNDSIILDSGETKSLEIIFDITKEADTKQYKIIFYSNVVSNNIAFIIDN